MLDENAEGWDTSNIGKALRLLEEILAYRPADAAANHQAAKLALSTGADEAALEYAQTANDLCPDSAPMSLTLAKAMHRCGMSEKAILKLNAAAALDPKNAEIQADLHELRRARRRT